MMKNEIAVDSFDSACAIAKELLKNNYVVMLSREEHLVIINYEWSCNGANRNDVVFMNREDFEDEYFSKVEDEDDEDNSQIRLF